MSRLVSWIREREREGIYIYLKKFDRFSWIFPPLSPHVGKISKTCGNTRTREIFILSTTVFYARKYYMNEICNFLVATTPFYGKLLLFFFVGIMFESCVAVTWIYYINPLIFCGTSFRRIKKKKKAKKLHENFVLKIKLKSENKGCFRSLNTWNDTTVQCAKFIRKIN